MPGLGGDHGNIQFWGAGGWEDGGKVRKGSESDIQFQVVTPWSPIDSENA